MTAVSVGPRHGVQPSAKTAPSRGEPGLALQRGDETDEHQPHQNGDDAADALQQKLIGQQRGGQTQHRHGAEQEHDGKPRHEQRRGPDDAQPGGPDRRAGGTLRSGADDVVLLDTHDGRQVGQVAGHQGYDTR